MAERPLEGKVAIITGAGSPIGIGHAIALGPGAGPGAKVALTDVNQEWLDQTINEVREIGGDDCAIAIVFRCNRPAGMPGYSGHYHYAVGWAAYPGKQRRHQPQSRRTGRH